MNSYLKRRIYIFSGQHNWLIDKNLVGKKIGKLDIKKTESRWCIAYIKKW